jgi:recombination protein RecA
MTELEKLKEEKLKTLRNTTLKALDKKNGENSYFLGKMKIPKVPLICSTGSFDLDRAIGIGGFPLGRIIEIGGQESSSKSTLTLINIAEIQTKGMLCAYIDAEQSFDPSWAMKMGVNVDELLITRPDCAEDAVEELYAIIDSGVVSYVVVDSTNALIPRSVFESDTAGDATMGKAARILSQELPKIQRKCTEKNCTVVFISQIRATMDKYHPEAIGIGNAMKFWASIRIKTSRADIDKDDGEEGQSKMLVKCNVFKNKIGVPFKKAEFTLLTGENGKYGIDTFKEVVDFGIRFEFVKKTSGWYQLPGQESKLNGMALVYKYFEENPVEFGSLKASVSAKLQEASEEEVSATPDSFDAVINEALNAEPKTRTRKKKEEPVLEETAIKENTSDAEIIE